MRGKVKFTAEQVAKLVEIFGLPAEYLVARDDGLSATTSKAEASAKGTYAELKKYILDHSGMKVSTLYIAQIKRKYGFDMRANYNESKKSERHIPICPPDKEQAILEAMIHFKLLDPDTEMIPNSEVMKDEG